MGAAGLGMTSRGGHGRAPAGLGTTSRDGGLGTTSRGGHGRSPAGDPRAAGEEGGGARGRASRGGKATLGQRAGQRRSELGGEGGNLLGAGSVLTSRH